MPRMTREFSLVLLGAGILTAGYFLWPAENMQARADEQAAQQVADTHRHRYGGAHLLFLPMHMGGGRASSPARAGISRGGFGGTGSAFSGGS